MAAYVRAKNGSLCTSNEWQPMYEQRMAAYVGAKNGSLCRSKEWQPMYEQRMVGSKMNCALTLKLEKKQLAENMYFNLCKATLN